MLSDKNGNLTNIWPSLMSGVIPPTSPQASGPSLGCVVPGKLAAQHGTPPAGVTNDSGNNPTQNGIPTTTMLPALDLRGNLQTAENS